MFLGAHLRSRRQPYPTTWDAILQWTDARGSGLSLRVASHVIMALGALMPPIDSLGSREAWTLPTLNALVANQTANIVRRLVRVASL